MFVFNFKFVALDFMFKVGVSISMSIIFMPLTLNFKLNYIKF